MSWEVAFSVNDYQEMLSSDLDLGYVLKSFF